MPGGEALEDVPEAASGRLAIDLTFGQRGQFLVCRLFLIEILLEHTRAVAPPELLAQAIKPP
jgi:hypothetical protein